MPPPRAAPLAGRRLRAVAKAEGSATISPIRRRILVVEDDAALRESLHDLLGAEGYAVAEAEDGSAALDMLATSPADVVVVDLAMPRMNGVEMLRRLDAPPPVVIIYSAFEYFGQGEVERELGAKVFRALQKPVPPAVLISTVAAALDQLDDI